MSTSLHRWISTAILLGWLAPSIAAMGIGIHLASAHHDHHDGEHQRELAQLAKAATHGHHHDLDSVPDHGHEARFDGQTPIFRPDLSLAAVLPAPLSGPTPHSQGSTLVRSQRDGPPVPLITANCSLLL